MVSGQCKRLALPPGNLKQHVSADTGSLGQGCHSLVRPTFIDLSGQCDKVFIASHPQSPSLCASAPHHQTKFLRRPIDPLRNMQPTQAKHAECERGQRPDVERRQVELMLCCCSHIFSQCCDQTLRPDFDTTAENPPTSASSAPHPQLVFHRRRCRLIARQQVQRRR